MVQEQGHWLNDDYAWGRITVNVWQSGPVYYYTVKFEWHIILNYDGNSPQWKLRSMILGVIQKDYNQVIYSKLARDYNWMWNPATNQNEYVGLDGPADKSFSYTYGPGGGGGNYKAVISWVYSDGSGVHYWDFPVLSFFVPGPY